MALGRGGEFWSPSPETGWQFRPGGGPPVGGTHSPQGHKKEDLWQVEGDIHPEIGLVEGGDGLWGRRGMIRDHAPTPNRGRGSCQVLPPRSTLSWHSRPQQPAFASLLTVPSCTLRAPILHAQYRSGRRGEREKRGKEGRGGRDEEGAGPGVRWSDGDSPCSLLKTARRRNMKAPQVAAKKPLQ